MNDTEEKFMSFYTHKVGDPTVSRVDHATEIFGPDGKPTGMFFIREEYRDRSDNAARFVSQRGETYSREFSTEFYDEICHDQARLLSTMHHELVRHVAISTGRAEYIPQGVRRLYPNLKQEIFDAMQRRVDSIQSPSRKKEEEGIMLLKRKQIQHVFEQFKARESE